MSVFCCLSKTASDLLQSRISKSDGYHLLNDRYAYWDEFKTL